MMIIINNIIKTSTFFTFFMILIHGFILLVAKIYPVVKNQHLLLCTLLIGNALAMESLPIFLDKLVPPWAAVLISVTLILMFGEILPQAICTRYGLTVGATVAPFGRLLLWLFYPIAYPISKALDWMLGKGHAALLRRAELKTFVDFHGNEVIMERCPSSTPAFKKRHRGCSFCILDLDNNPIPNYPANQIVVGVITMEDVIEELLQPNTGIFPKKYMLEVCLGFHCSFLIKCFIHHKEDTKFKRFWIQSNPIKCSSGEDVQVVENGDVEMSKFKDGNHMLF